MKFIMERTSIETSAFDEGSQPCEESKKEILALTYFDYRTVETFEEAKEHNWFNNWMRKGINHREDKEKKMIVRDLISEEKLYTIEIQDLEDILNLQRKYGKIIITKSSYEEIPLVIEIYDDYRE